MTRKECLDKAAECVLQDRNSSYGEPEDSFDLIADLWMAYTGYVFIGSDVAAMMALLKLARLKLNARHLDSAVDLAGYAACFAECASAEMARHVPFASKAEDELEFKPGDKVQVQRTGHREWENAVYVMSHPSGFGHIVRHPDDGRIAIDDERVRPAPKAEGCEELVVSPFDAPRTPVEDCENLMQEDPPLCGDRCEEYTPGQGVCSGCRHAREKDAPQTKEELYQHIVDCNPATFKAHKPTGEELAEMAEEVGNG